MISSPSPRIRSSLHRSCRLVLLDENLPHSLRGKLSGRDVRIAAFQGWSGLTNGALLNAAEEAGFEVLVTADKSIRYQQNMNRSLAFVVLSTNQRSIVLYHAESILAAIATALPGRVIVLDLGEETPRPN